MSAAKAIHDALIPRIPRVVKPLPDAIVEKLAKQGVRLAARQQAIAARPANAKGAKVAAKAAAAKPAPAARSLANPTASAEPAPATMLDRSKALSVKELNDGTVVVKLAPNKAAEKIALDAHHGVGPKRGSPAFTDAIAAAMGPAADDALAAIVKASPDAKVRVMAGSTEMGVRNLAPSPSAPAKVAPAVIPAGSVAVPPAPVVVVPSPAPAAPAPVASEASASPAAPAASPASPGNKPAAPPGKPS